MATPISTRRVGFLQPAPEHPQLKPQDMAFWSPPKGVDYLVRAMQIDRNHMWDASNFVIIDGRIQPRKPLATLGSFTSETCEVGLFVTSDGFIHIFRMTPTTIEYWNNSAWVVPTGAPLLTGNQGTHLSYTAWNDHMVWTNGRDGVYDWDWSTNTVTTITTIYIPKFLTTFMSRIFMANVLESGNQQYTIMRWSVKNNSNDFAGVGSGYEDFRSTPGGYMDKLQTIIPINDSQALAIRENSTWLISETGNVDAPVRTGRQFANLGTKAPRSIVGIAGGALGLFTDGIYVVSESGIQNIGTKIIRRIQERVSDFDSCVGAYDNDLKRYSLSVFDDQLATTVVYQYSFPDESWMVMYYPVRIHAMAYAQSPLVGLTIDTSPGTFDAAVGTIDSEVGSASASQLYFSGPVGSGMNAVMHEDTYSSFTVLAEESGAYGSLSTGILVPSSPLNEIMILEVQIVYESSHFLEGTIEYSTTLGQVWDEYSTVTMDVVSQPSVLRFTKTISGYNIQLRFKAAIRNQGFKLLAFVPLVVEGEKRHP